MYLRDCTGILAAAVLLLPTHVLAQTLQATVADSGGPMVTVFAGGAIRDVAGGKEQADNVAGSLGLRYTGAMFAVTGLINVASTEDTIRSGFGETLLAPASGAGLNAGLLEVRARRFRQTYGAHDCGRHPEAIKCHFGFRAYVSASSALWAVDVDSADVVQAAEVVPSWGTGLAMSYTFFNDVLDDGSRAGMVLDAGFVSRHVRGDLSGAEDRFAELVGTSKTDFVGVEVGLSLHYNSLRGGLTYYYLNGELDGLSRGQVVAGFSIEADFNASELPNPPAQPPEGDVEGSDENEEDGGDQPPAL